MTFHEFILNGGELPVVVQNIPIPANVFPVIPSDEDRAATFADVMENHFYNRECFTDDFFTFQRSLDYDGAAIANRLTTNNAAIVKLLTIFAADERKSQTISTRPPFGNALDYDAGGYADASAVSGEIGANAAVDENRAAKVAKMKAFVELALAEFEVFFVGVL